MSTPCAIFCVMPLLSLSPIAAVGFAWDTGRGPQRRLALAGTMLASLEATSAQHAAIARADVLQR